MTNLRKIILAALRALRASSRHALPAIGFTQVVGFDQALNQARAVVQAFSQTSTDADAPGAPLPKGVIIHGEGCGSASLARAIAGELQATYMELEIPPQADSDNLQLQAVRQRFNQARRSGGNRKAPVVLFVGGLDLIASHSQASMELAEQMDRIGDNQGVLVIAEVVRLADVDKELLGKNRFDIEIAVEKPDFGGRQAIFSHSMLCRGYHRNVVMHVPVATEAERLEEIERIAEECARRSKDFSAAEIYAALHEAVLCATKRTEAAAEANVEVREDELYAAIRMVKIMRQSN